ncbi:MAG TPA: DNA polymerase III subunit gamma/tau, partial [Pyrinomonadaceae bacterium]|nr:DNA polymerase III subunit gamma/tau [Pyrinomonadaceae bacterium]
MAYQVIARKWRPQTFDEVTGQEPITRTLRNAIEHRRLHHAYLFSGARGVGKTTSARLLAKALNCHKSSEPTPTPCRSDDPTACPSCREITESRSIDVQEIDAASNTGVDNVRDAIIASVGIAPARDRYKIFIIDEVHMLSGAAFNALLKTLEEPPPRVVFIMATTEKHKVPETILSRCQQFEFRTIATAKILERLKLIAKEEKISIPEDALREIARTGEGSMRDAQSALDQVISFAGTKIKKEDVEMALGVAGADILTRVIDSIATNNPAGAIAVVDDIVMRGHDLRNFCRDLLAHFRDLLVTKVSGNEELLESAVCDIGELKRQAALFSESDLVRFFHSLSETETKLRAATQPRYQLEVGIVKLMELRGVETIGEILQRLNALESGAPPAAPAPPKTPSRAAGSSFGAATTAAAPAMEKTEPATPIDRIKSVLERQKKMLLVTTLDEAQATVLENGELYVEFGPAARRSSERLSSAENMKFLVDA